MQVTESVLRAMCPRPRSGVAKQTVWDGYVAALVSDEAAKLFEAFDVTTVLRMSNFLANAAHESGGFTIILESGAYSAERIMEIFGVGRHSAKVTAEEARRLARNGPALFERVYGLGNPRKAAELGNTEPGDGWRCRGVGIMQITGRRDHERFAAAIGCSPADLVEPINAVHAALLEWREKGCNRWADRGDVVKVRQLINGGRNGLPEVRSYQAAAQRLLERQAPIPASEYAPVDNVIRLGSEGPLVEWLQQRLALHGYYVGLIDGRFGVETEKKLVAWQHQHGFRATGIFDPDDGTQRSALEMQPTKTESPRRDVTADDLADRGSKTVNTTRWWKRLFRWLIGGEIAAGVDHATGLGIVDSMVSQAEQARSLVERTSGLVRFIPETKILVLLAAVLAAYAVYRAFDVIERRRVDDARSGANVGK